MSGRILSFVTAEVALTAATAKTVLQIVAAAQHAAKLLKYKISFDGTSVTAEPVQVRILRQTTAGTMSSLAAVKVNPAAMGETIQTTGQHTATAEPTAGDVLDAFECHPQSGFAETLSLGQEIDINGGTRLGFECTAPATVNVRISAWIEE